MLTNIKLRKKQAGFTIIEVMIVLAIAALILLIVLLAVPALQRNSKNTTLKNDVATIAGGINTFESDNNGIVPTNIAVSAGVVTVKAATGTAETVNINGGTVIDTGATASSGSATAPSTTSVGSGAIYPLYQAQCNPTTPSSPTFSARSIALYYLVETSGSPILSCSTS